MTAHVGEGEVDRKEAEEQQDEEQNRGGPGWPPEGQDGVPQTRRPTDHEDDYEGDQGRGARDRETESQGPQPVGLRLSLRIEPPCVDDQRITSRVCGLLRPELLEDGPVQGPVDGGVLFGGATESLQP